MIEQFCDQVAEKLRTEIEAGVRVRATDEKKSALACVGLEELDEQEAAAVEASPA
jgi:hypothetical protein